MKLCAKKIFPALILCGALSLGINSNSVEASEVDLNQSNLNISAGAENFQQLDFWSRLRDTIVFGDDRDDDRRHDRRDHRESRYGDRDHRPPPPPPPPEHRRGHRPPPPPPPFGY